MRNGEGGSGGMCNGREVGSLEGKGRVWGVATYPVSKEVDLVKALMLDVSQGVGLVPAWRQG